MDVVAVISLAFVASITPGPNNLMLWSSGMNYGVRATLRHLAGVNLGFTFLLFVVASGLGTLFERFDWLELTLKLAGGVFLLYLAYAIFTTSSIGEAERRPPMSFFAAAAFQWVNPKAWVMTITATSTGLDESAPIFVAALLLSLLFGVVNLPCISAWVVTGAYASRFLDNPRRLQIANRVLGTLLAATVVLIVT